MKDFTFADFKDLMEKAYHAFTDPMSVPFGMDPFSNEAMVYRQAKRERIAELEHRLEGLGK